MTEQTQTTVNGKRPTSAAVTGMPEKVIEKGTLPDGRPFHLYHGGYLENALGKELAHILRGNRIRILKAFAAAIEESEAAARNGDRV